MVLSWTYTDVVKCTQNTVYTAANWLQDVYYNIDTHI